MGFLRPPPQPYIPPPPPPPPAANPVSFADASAVGASAQTRQDAARKGAVGSGFSGTDLTGGAVGATPKAKNGLLGQ